MSPKVLPKLLTKHKSGTMELLRQIDENNGFYADQNFYFPKVEDPIFPYRLFQKVRQLLYFSDQY